MRHLASQGIFTGGKRPFGFDIVLDAEVVRLAPNVAEMGPIPGSFSGERGQFNRISYSMSIVK
jgi:hypothetical protein